MRITPLEIQQKQFKHIFLRGLDPEDVQLFLEIVRTEFEELVKENNSLKDELRRRLGEIEEYRDRETTLKETMMTAQRISEDIKTNAKKDAELVVSEAMVQADKIIQGAHGRLLTIVEEINELKRQRITYESSLRSLLAAHSKLLEATLEANAEQTKRDEKVQFFAKKIKKAASEGKGGGGDEPVYE